MIVKIANKSKKALPEYATILSAGMVLRANLENSVIIEPLERKLTPTGLFIELPEGYEAQIRPRKGKTENKKQTRNKENHLLKFY